MMLESEELLRIDFLTDLVEREGLQARIDVYREGFLRCEPRTVSSMKRHIDAIVAGDWTEETGHAYDASLTDRKINPALP